MVESASALEDSLFPEPFPGGGAFARKIVLSLLYSLRRRRH